jgi:DNA-directed RNA polymerase specialized sigma24 family protein
MKWRNIESSMADIYEMTEELETPTAEELETYFGEECSASALSSGDEEEEQEPKPKTRAENERARQLAWEAGHESRRVAGGHGEVKHLTPEEAAERPIAANSEKRALAEYFNEQNAIQNKRKAAKNIRRLHDGFYHHIATGEYGVMLERCREYITRRFTKMTEEHETNGAEGLGNDTSDYVQRCLIRIYNGIDEFEGTAFDFEKWVNVICAYRVKESVRALRKARATFTSFTVVVEGEDGESEEIENPEIFRSLANVGAPASEYWRPARIPADAQGLDLEILEALYYTDSNKTHAEIAEKLGVTPARVAQRIRAMHDKYAPMWAEEKKAKEARLKAKDDQYNKHLEHRMAYYNYRKIN